MDINLYVHQVGSDIDSKLDLILKGLRILMGKADDMKAELVAANEATNEIAGDLQDLISRVGDGSLSPTEADEIKKELEALRAKLTGVASQHTP